MLRIEHKGMNKQPLQAQKVNHVYYCAQDKSLGDHELANYVTCSCLIQSGLTSWLPCHPQWYWFAAGSLLVVLLLRTAHYNMSKMKDVYMHQNTLAALANVAPHMSGISSHAAQRLVSLFDMLAKR